MTQAGYGKVMEAVNLRLCRLFHWPTHEKFGFDLQQSVYPPHIIFVVESNSPAAAAGLKALDVVLAVNQCDVSNYSFDELERLIKSASNSNMPIELLVVRQLSYQTLKKIGISIDSSFATIIDGSMTMPIEHQNLPNIKPRICILRLNSLESVFGFIIVPGENGIGAYVQEIRPYTSASRAQLRKNDRIIEMDDKFVDNDTIESIIDQLAAIINKRTLKLYVMDVETYEYYNQNKLPLLSKHTTCTLLSPLLILLDEDIRLCTISCTHVDDTFGIKLNYNLKENFYSLIVLPNQNDRSTNAELAGIKSDDRLIEINNQNIEKFDFDYVSQLLLSIKYPQSLQLLVTNASTYQFYTQQGKLIHQGLSNVITLTNDNFLI